MFKHAVTAKSSFLYTVKAVKACGFLLIALCLLLTACGGGGGGGGGSVSLGGGTDSLNGDSVSITIPFTRSRAGFSQGLMDLNPKSISLKVTATKAGTTKVLYDETFSGEQVITVKAAVGSRLDATATINLESGETRTASGVLESVARGANTLTVYVKYKCLLYTDPDAEPIVCYYTAKTGFTVPKTVTYDGTLYAVVGAYELTQAGPGTPYPLNKRISQTGDMTIAVELKEIAPGGGGIPEPDPEPAPPFELDENGFIIAINDSAISADGSVTIPDQLEDGTLINGFASGFNFPNTITVVDMSTSAITALPDSLFNGCTGLQSITLPNGLASIGNSAFRDCTGLQSITLPNGLNSIGDSAFSDCTGLQNITLPNGLASIGDSAFSDCTGLQNITLPSSLASIGDYAFKGCTGLSSVSFPSTLTSMGSGAFRGCTQLATVSDLGSTQLTVISDNAFAGCGFTSIQLPSGVTSIGENAFNGCRLTSITLPASLTSIGKQAFYFSSLSQVSILSSVQSIGQNAFASCSQLTVLTINGTSLTSIGSSAFAYSGLSSVTLTAVSTLGEKMFYGCDNLTSITIPNTVASIGKSAFAESGLSSVTLQQGLTTLGESMFESCPELLSITLPNSLTAIGENAFRWCENLEHVNIQGGNDDTLPPLVIVLEAGIFNGCENLKGLNTNNVTTLKYRCFYESGLTNLTMPKVTQINGEAFYECGALTEMYFGEITPPSIVDNTWCFYPGYGSILKIHIRSNADEDTWRITGFVQEISDCMYDPDNNLQIIKDYPD